MKLTIEIEMDNAAFGDLPEDAAMEACMILENAQAALGEFIGCPMECSLQDVNGSTVGMMIVTD